MLDRSDLDADQINALEFIASGEDTLLAADIGTGKTVIALTAARDALAAGEVSRWLVLAPLLVATDTWAKEPARWAHLADLRLGIACGSFGQRRLAIEADPEILVTNYENLDWLLKQYPKVKSRGGSTFPFDGLIADEVDKLKSVSSERFKAFRNRIGVFRKRIGMTGTLIPNDLTELWAQMYMVDGGASFSDIVDNEGKRIGRSFYRWRKHFFYPTDFNQYNWAPFKDTEQALLDALDGLAYRLPARGLPKVILTEPERMTLTPRIRPLYTELEREYYALVEDTAGKKREIDADNAGVLQGKLQQICAGFSYVDGGKEAVWHCRARYGWLERLIQRLQGQQLLVFYHFVEELEELRRRYPDMPWIGGGVPAKKKAAAIDAWNAGSVPLLAMHPASAGHGLNLQHSGARHIAFLTLPWSGGMFNQAVGRLARRGNPSPQVYVHTAQFIDTVDEHVLRVVSSRRGGMADFLAALYDRQHAGVHATDEGRA